MNDEWFVNLKQMNREEKDLFINERNELLKQLEELKVSGDFRNHKLYSESLSPGCRCCGEGFWSCLFINRICSADCLFCPQDRGITEEALPYSDGQIFESADAYLEYFKKMGYRGAGFTGGEPFLVLDRLCEYIDIIRQNTDSDTWIWAYTNGKQVTPESLERLKTSGLNELRFNIVATDYSLDSVKIAKDYIDVVTVEIPAIPEDEEKLKSTLHLMEKARVDFLNLHQLYSTEYNYNKMSPNYRYMVTNDNLNQCVDSELTGLRILKYVLEMGVDLSVNFCNQSYKSLFQSSGCAVRRAHQIIQSWEGITEKGYIRCIRAETKQEELVRLFDSSRTKQGHYFYDRKSGDLYVHSDLLHLLKEASADVVVEYWLAEASEDSGRIKRSSIYKTPVMADFRGFETEDYAEAVREMRGYEFAGNGYDLNTH